MDNAKTAFEELNRLLAGNQMTLSVICVGGFVLEHHGLRATQDIDAFYKETQKTRELITEVGAKYAINTDELWLNNSVANMNLQPPENICEVLYQLSNLTVLAAPIEYILGMKLESGREQDLKDIGMIIRYKHFTSPFLLFDWLKEEGFAQIDFSMLLEGFSYAYGMEWLESFYKENQEELKKFF